MSNALLNIPAETDLLCEECGYVLNGLSDDSNCPECGKAAVNSSRSRRQLPAWEGPGDRLALLYSTTLEVLFHPTRFYRSLATRAGREKSYRFALIHWLIASVLMGTAVYVHMNWFMYVATSRKLRVVLDLPVPAIAIYSAMALLTLDATSRIAARLTTWEAGYRGYRLPLSAVLRGLDYHAAHYLPVALLTSATILGYRWMLYRHWVGMLSETTYLYVLCGEVVVGAAYLFNTYWIGMRNMLYANA